MEKDSPFTFNWVILTGTELLFTREMAALVPVPIGTSPRFTELGDATKLSEPDPVTDVPPQPEAKKQRTQATNTSRTENRALKLTGFVWLPLPPVTRIDRPQ
jgi:hypothetical protein